MKPFHIFFIAPLFFYSLSSFAQKEAYNWVFGENAAITFNTTPPSSILPGAAIVTQEGCASISDGAGNLLFYTDGSTVWDKNNLAMPNGTGLLGNNSSTQSAVIVPKPADPGNYYVFAVGLSSFNNNGLTFSEIDMSLNAGDGDVLAVNKNTQLIFTAAEKLTAVQHNNGLDIWVIVHTYSSDSFYTYRVSPVGVNPVPVISKVGPVTSSDNIGYLKASPNGDHIGMAQQAGSILSLFDFDNSTGLITHTIDMTISGSWVYGVEFSPNSQLMYTAVNDTVFQFDITNANIPSTKTAIGSSGSDPWGLQLGPDNKIYVANYQSTFLDVVDQPDVVGVGATFVPSYVTLATGKCRLGFPTFIQSFFINSEFSFNGVCFGDSTYFTTTVNNIDSVYWDFGDPASGSSNNSSQFDPGHIFSDTGTFTVSLTVFDSIFSNTSTQTVTIIDPFIDIGPDTLICLGENVMLNGTTSNASYLWSTNNTGPSITTSGAGWYWLEITLDSACSYRDSMLVSEIEALTQENIDTVSCEEFNLNLNVAQLNATYLWNSGSTSPNAVIDEGGTYYVTITNSCESVIDTFNVVLENCVCDVAIPDAFSPNEDGLNDHFTVMANCSLYDVTLRVYDRWGNMIYESISNDAKWNGLSEGKAMPVGNYTYFLQYKTDDNPEMKIVQGIVSLFR